MADESLRERARRWAEHDPDPVTAAELTSSSDADLAQRLVALRFGTAGLRGPVRAGPGGMNVAVVARAVWAVAQVLEQAGESGSTVVVGRDARFGSEAFAATAAQVLAAAGFVVTVLPAPLPTPVLAFAVRAHGAAAGVMVTASHNPPGDNGLKVYLRGGLQIVEPVDAQVEAAVDRAPPADEVPCAAVSPDPGGPDPFGADTVEQYLRRMPGLRRHPGAPRVALTALHGVGGDLAVEALRRAGVTDVHPVAAQHRPDPRFPTVAFPNPEEPGATDELLALAARVGADVAVALDPDADRCAVGVPTATGWRMLSGDETGWLLGDHLLRDSVRPATVASTVVSSRMLRRIADTHGARHVETLTGFKWLARADDTAGGAPLRYAYEEAIGHCVDPEAVRDKDGIAAAVVVCDLVAALAERGATVPDALDELARRHGVHLPAALSRRVDDAAAVMARLRAAPPTSVAGMPVAVTDLAAGAGPRTDALIVSGGDGQMSVRLAVRPSGTEPKIKCYTEVRVGVTDDAGADGLAAARATAAATSRELLAAAAALLDR